jgi:Na+/proline symporter
LKALDWVVLAVWLIFIVSYGLYRGRGSNTVDRYLRAGNTMPWYAMGLSIMATQASAITFISTTAQAYVDGMRFVQFYFGLPIAMVILSATAVPIFHRARVYTAYEYLEQRFDVKTRTAVGAIFLIQRGLAAGLSLYAPAVVLSVILGWPDYMTTSLMGALVVIYTTTGGIKAVTWADVQQMIMIFGALILGLALAFYLMPSGVSVLDAIHLAGAAGRLNPVDLHFDLNNRYNLWSGLLGGSFLALSYFGCDQSQVQRYLTGRSIAQSRLSLLFNAIAKIPMQTFILFIGAMVFVLFLFVKPPVIFHPLEAKRLEQSAQWNEIRREYDAVFAARRQSALQLAHSGSSKEQSNVAAAAFHESEAKFEAVRKKALRAVDQVEGTRGFNDTNYIFLSYVTRFLPVGIVGLLVAVIFSAAMSSSSGEINSLATVSVIDFYQRFVRKGASDRHYLWASRIFTLFWGTYAVLFANSTRSFGALIEAVNQVGSLFYGSMLGVFVLAFFFKRVGGTAAFIGVLVGEAAILSLFWFTSIAYLWFNVIGCIVVVLAACCITPFVGSTNKRPGEVAKAAITEAQ